MTLPFKNEINQDPEDIFIYRSLSFFISLFCNTCNILPLSLKKSCTICIWLPLSKFLYIFPSLLCFPFKWFIHQLLELAMMEINWNVPTEFCSYPYSKMLNQVYGNHTSDTKSKKVCHKEFYLNIDIIILIPHSLDIKLVTLWKIFLISLMD